MSEVVMRDHAIKLFGKTITLSPDENVFADIVSVTDQGQSTEDDKDISMDEDNHEFADQAEQAQIEELEDEEASAPLSETRKNTSDSQSKTPKRPDKILPCPRCESSDTKFCYYNNYSTNQPRHFCKKCHRYWTDGGSMRKIPIGSGRRKNKKAASVPDVVSMMMDFNFRSVQPNELYESNYPYSGFPVAFCPANQNRDGAVYSKGSSSSTSSSSNVPKSLKIHDPSEAAKSSTWCTLGYEKNNGTRNVFKAFESSNHRERISRNLDCSSLILQANPAALSRSLNFHENA